MPKRKKSRKKAEQPIDIRLVTTWTSVAAFGLLAAMVGLASWFVWASLQGFGRVPDLRDDLSTDEVVTVNVMLMQDVGESLDAKVNTPISPTGESVNPFTANREPEPPPAPAEPETAPPEAGTEPAPEPTKPEPTT